MVRKRTPSGVMYNENNLGPRTEPCTTPQPTKQDFDEDVPMHAPSCLLAIYDLNQERHGSWIPNLCWSRDISVSRFTLSNASDRSNTKSRTHPRLSMALRISVGTRTSAVFVLWYRRYADW